MERTDQTADHALRCIIGEKDSREGWEDYLPYVQHAMNTLIKRAPKLPRTLYCIDMTLNLFF